MPSHPSPVGWRSDAPASPSPPQIRSRRAFQPALGHRPGRGPTAPYGGPRAGGVPRRGRGPRQARRGQPTPRRVSDVRLARTHLCSGLLVTAVAALVFYPLRHHIVGASGCRDNIVCLVGIAVITLIERRQESRKSAKKGAAAFARRQQGTRDGGGATLTVVPEDVVAAIRETPTKKAPARRGASRFQLPFLRKALERDYAASVEATQRPADAPTPTGVDADWPIAVDPVRRGVKLTITRPAGDSWTIGLMHSQDAGWWTVSSPRCWEQSRLGAF